MKKEYTISPEIYDGGAISEAIEDFSEVSEINFSNTTLSIEGESEEEIQEIFLEFMNYVLSI